MQLLEIKNDLAKIRYNPNEKKFFLADFLIISDDNQNLLAQIIHLESTSNIEVNLCLIKFILAVDKEGVISAYNGYIPMRTATINHLETKEVVELLKTTNQSMSWGPLAAHRDVYLNLDLKLLDNNLYIQCESYDSSVNIVNNIVSGLSIHSQKAVIVDFDGIYKNIKATNLTLTDDFKLPLNQATISYIYNNDLEELDIKSKAVVQDILLELVDYVKTTEDGYLPFNTFKMVVDQVYQKDPSSGIILIRNKLIQYAKEGLFAQVKEHFDIINSKLQDEDIVVIDATAVNHTWHKEILNFLISHINQKCNLIVNLDEYNSDKKIIAKLYNANKKIHPIVLSTYKYENAQLLKAIAKNLILFLPIEELKDFAGYNSFLAKLNYDEFIIWGENTLRIPFIVKLKERDTEHTTNKVQQEITDSVDKIFRGNLNQSISPQSFEIVESNEDLGVQDTLDVPIIDEESIDIPEVVSASQNIMENSESVTYQLSPVDEPPQVISADEYIDTLYREDSELQYNYDEVFSDEDLDFIDELNSGDFDSAKIGPDSGVDTSLTQQSKIPVVDADIANETGADISTYQEGLVVNHPKYGRGIVEKIIEHGNKKLCLVQFDTEGRKILDPNLAVLEPV